MRYEIYRALNDLLKKIKMKSCKLINSDNLSTEQFFVLDIFSRCIYQLLGFVTVRLLFIHISIKSVDPIV